MGIEFKPNARMHAWLAAFWANTKFAVSKHNFKTFGILLGKITLFFNNT